MHNSLLQFSFIVVSYAVRTTLWSFLIFWEILGVNNSKIFSHLNFLGQWSLSRLSPNFRCLPFHFSWNFPKLSVFSFCGSSFSLQFRTCSTHTALGFVLGFAGAGMHTVCCCVMFLLLAVSVSGQSDFGSLLELKKGITKDPSSVLLSWDSKSLGSDGCPHNWYGIVCINGRVTSITLNDEGLVGDLNFAAIAGLTMLRNLSLSNNQLTGTITSAASIKSLEYLDISRNMFHGSIPSLSLNLFNLVLLNLSYNQFEGAVPHGSAKSEKLNYIDLRGNAFSGDILQLFSQMGSTVFVDLSSNNFSGSLEVGLGNSYLISSIQYLNLSHNILTGELFVHDGMPYFDSLEVFDASNNQFAGAIPSFNFVVSLKILRLGSNQFSGSIPEALLQDSSMLLSELDLSLNQLEGPVGSVTSATLKKLNISSNRLSGSLPTSIGHCAVLDLSNNMLTGKLSRIQGWGNYVEVIQLSSNLLTGGLPNQTSQFLRLISLQVSNNSLQGVLPEVLCTYPELEVIDLSFNQLSGSIPPCFFNSTRLTDLNLSGNNFSGSVLLPENVSSSQNLSLISLDLSHNSVTGHIPLGLSKFHSLVYLNLSKNNFEGAIPDDLPDGLRGFDVSSNNLSGIIPGNLRRFPDMAFHPGNSLLISPNSQSPKDTNSPTFMVRGSHMKTATRIALIVCLVGAAAVLALLSVMIYYRAQWLERRRRSSGGSIGNEGVAEDCSRRPEPNQNVKVLLSSSSLNQDLKTSSQKESSEDVIRHTSSFPKKYHSPGYSELLHKEGGNAPVSLMSSFDLSSYRNQHRSSVKAWSPDKLPGDLHLFDGSLLFTVEELSSAPAETIGRSCHGALYKATLQSGHILAVKWLREGMAKGGKEFAREVQKLGFIRHPNLVSVNGYYLGPNDRVKLVISNFIHARSLASYLQEMEQRKLPPLSIEERLRIALNVGQCLDYLHNEKAIPHGNLKSTNILLEAPAMNARLSDYSLHRILTPAGTAEQVLNAGALGYGPPEFASTSTPWPSLKSDVYAFGVILLELLTGKHPGGVVFEIPGIELADWVRFLASENRSGECLDGAIVDGDNADCLPEVVDGMLQVALRCTLPAAERPDMKTVVEELSQIMQWENSLVVEQS